MPHQPHPVRTMRKIPELSTVAIRAVKREVAEYLGDGARTVLAVYAHVLGEGQRRDHLQRLASAEQTPLGRGHLGDTQGIASPIGGSSRLKRAAPKLDLHPQEPVVGGHLGTAGEKSALEKEQALPRRFEERPGRRGDGGI